MLSREEKKIPKPSIRIELKELKSSSLTAEVL